MKSTLLEEMMKRLDHNFDVSYSAICKTQCDVLFLNKANFLKRFPKDLQKQFSDFAEIR